MTTKSVNNQSAPYNHKSYHQRRKFLKLLLKYLGFPLLAKVDKVEGLQNIPREGAAIVMINHIAYIDPIVVVSAAHRDIVPLAKIEVYSMPVVGIFPRIWHVIPVSRDDVDRQTLRQIYQVLDAGEIVLIAPEGTRSPQLQKGKEGVAYISSKRNVPIIPVAIEGSEGFPALRYSSAWKGPGASVSIGRPFRYKEHTKKADRVLLRKMTDEAMYILAEMLAPERRGVYSDLSKASQDTIEWV